MFQFHFAYEQLPGLILPVVLCAYFAVTGKIKGFNGPLLLIFLGSTLLDIQLAHWNVSPHRISLNGYPICALAVLFASIFSSSTRAGAYLGYCMVFFSELCRDLICGFHYAIIHGMLTAYFFTGVGGAGFEDGLFMQPLLTALSLAVLARLPAFERRFMAGSFLAKPVSFF